MGRHSDAAAAMLLGLTVLFSVTALSGCSAGATPAPSTTSASSPSPSLPPTPSPTAPKPSLDPNLSAEQNLAFFDEVNLAVVAANADAQGRDFIDALIAAGFARSAMQVTSDTTTIGDRADSVQFSVEFGEACLIGQYGPKSGGYQSAVQPVLGTGGCLIGETRPIDW